MFGTWISDVQHALSAAFPADRPYRAEDLKSSQMPTAVGHFLTHALSRRAAHVEFSVESEWFDPDAPEVQTALETYRKALVSTARYPASIWQSSLERSVQFVVEFIANPATGLVSFAFGDSKDPLPVGRVRDRLFYFGTHHALREIILGYLDRKKMEEIGPEDLRALVMKADRSLVSDYEPEQWASHIAPLYEIAAVVPDEEHEEAQVPTGLLKAFFAAKDCPEIVRRLEAIESVKGDSSLGLERLRKVVGEKAAPEESVPEAEVAETTATDSEKRVPGTRVVRNDMHREAKPSVVPRWMQFAGGTAAGKAAANATSPSADEMPAEVNGSSEDPADADSSRIGQRAPVPDDVEIDASGDGVQTADVDPAKEPTSSGSVPRWTRFRESGPASTADEGELADAEKRVLGHLNAVQRAWFVNHLFGSDREHWRTVIEQLAKAADWNEASEIIAEEVFERHSVDIYSRPAVDFTNAVEARFR